MPETLAISEHVPLAWHTTLGLGGPARWFCACHDQTAVGEALVWAAERRIPVHVLGGGSNTVFSDDGFPGLVIQPALEGLTFTELGDGWAIEVAAGMDWDAVVAEAVTRELSGMECLSGIPGWAGAAPIQNIGAYGQELSSVLETVSCLDRRSLEHVSIPAAECDFSYRFSRFKGRDRDRYVILGMTLKLRADSRPVIRYGELEEAVNATSDWDRLDPGQAVRRVRETVLALRRRKGMVIDSSDSESRSVGSFFLNPVLSMGEVDTLVEKWRSGGGTEPVPGFPVDGRVKVPAAWLIERAGFPRGHEVGRVRISRRHALALVNDGGTARDLLALAASIERGVFERFGIRLEREPVVVDQSAWGG